MDLNQRARHLSLFSVGVRVPVCAGMAQRTSHWGKHSKNRRLEYLRFDFMHCHAQIVHSDNCVLAGQYKHTREARDSLAAVIFIKTYYRSQKKELLVAMADT